MLQELLNKEKKIALIGLGYVGLPIALEFANFFDVIGFDINSQRVDLMNNKIDPSNELKTEDFDHKTITFSSNENILKDANFFIVAVPTPVTESKTPNLKPLESASKTVGKALKKGDYVVFESTVYPGCTEEICIPILEKESGLKFNDDFKIGYSPERINPGDKKHTITSITKIVSGSDDESLEVIASVYEQIITAGVYKASSIKVAEAAKVIENTQRDLNISFMNELSIIFDKLNINTGEVLKAAGTKWNFLPFYPGLVGGHCIGVDPYYLTYKSKQVGYDPQVILSGRRINDYMPTFVAKKAVQLMIKAGKDPKESNVLVMGITFKENVSDIRNSKVADMIKELKEFSLNVDVFDDYADKNEVKKEYNIDLVQKIGSNYDSIIVAVGHDRFKSFDEAYFEGISNEKGLLIDLKNLYNNINKMTYWSL